MNMGAPVLETATETGPVAVTLFPASERSAHTLSVTLKDCGVYKPMRPDSTGGLELLSARLSICPQNAARNTSHHALNDEKYRMILQFPGFAKILPLRLNDLYSFKWFSRSADGSKAGHGDINSTPRCNSSGTGIISSDHQTTNMPLLRRRPGSSRLRARTDSGEFSVKKSRFHIHVFLSYHQ